MDEGSYKAKVVYVSDMEPQEITKHSETQVSMNSSLFLHSQSAG